MNAILTWLSAHPKIVAVILICFAAVLSVALFMRADVLSFFNWLTDLVK